MAGKRHLGRVPAGPWAGPDPAATCREDLSAVVFGCHPHSKTLHNTDASGTKDNVPDLEVWGNGDMFKLLCKASSKSEGWMKSTKAMEIEDVGCVVQVTTQQGDQIAEALTFVPGVFIQIRRSTSGEIASRRLVRTP